jgi:hypothetical protein
MDKMSSVVIREFYHASSDKNNATTHVLSNSEIP